MSKKTVNKIRNPHFAGGKKAPTSWTWDASGEATFERIEGGDGEESGVSITLAQPDARAGFAQRVVCKPETHYRIEMRISCDLSDPGDEPGGASLTLTPVEGVEPAGETLHTPPVTNATSPVDVAAYWKSPEDIRRADISVVVAGTAGWATIHDVRFIEVLEPDQESHILAIPAPPNALPAPYKVRKVAVCGPRANDRPITELLQTALGKRAVTAHALADFPAALKSADAVICPGDDLPKGIRSLAALMRAAEDRVVMISLGAFSKLCPPDVRIRTIKQDDDPIHAKIMFASFATRGFALHDTFPYAARTTGTMQVQRQFRGNKKFEAFAEKNKLTVLVASMCDQDNTSDQPITLFRRTKSGALIVHDIDPVESAPSAAGEANLALHLLLSLLGQSTTGAGQYISADWEEAEFRNHLREMNIRFRGMSLHDNGLPPAEITDQLVTVGDDDQGFGLPITPKRAIILRTGLAEGEVLGTYSALLWIKQLLRMPPHRCPYADQLASRFRFAWLAHASLWGTHHGWDKPFSETIEPAELEIDGDPVAALIDVSEIDVNIARVVVPNDGPLYAPLLTALPQLFETFGAGRHLVHSAPAGGLLANRSAYAWSRDWCELTIDVESSAFAEPVHEEVHQSGGALIRIDLPCSPSDFACASIYRTDLGVSLIEWIIGLQFGLIAPNRTEKSIRFNGYPPVKPGEAIVSAESPTAAGAQKAG